jgi:hypothetical protein
MTSNDSVVLHGVPTGLSTVEGRAFVAECVRAAHSIVTDADVQARFEIPRPTGEAVMKARSIRLPRQNIDCGLTEMTDRTRKRLGRVSTNAVDFWAWRQAPPRCLPCRH